MSGPLQWTGGGFVPANGIVPNPGAQKNAFVPEMAEPAVHTVEELEVVRKNVTAAIKKAKPGPVNVLALAKARLREVKAELRRLKALEKEQGELERLIAAAETKPSKSNLREIKRTAG